MIFQGAKTTITKLLQAKHATFLTMVHCVIHGWTKLVVQILNSLCFTTKSTLSFCLQLLCSFP
jgi:hypothetical protein